MKLAIDIAQEKIYLTQVIESQSTEIKKKNLLYRLIKAQKERINELTHAITDCQGWYFGEVYTSKDIRDENKILEFLQNYSV